MTNEIPIKYMNYLPVDAFVEVLDVDAMQVVQIMDVSGQVLLELMPADLYDLVSDVALHHLHKVHHLVSVEQRERDREMVKTVKTGSEHRVRIKIFGKNTNKHGHRTQNGVRTYTSRDITQKLGLGMVTNWARTHSNWVKTQTR